MLFYLKEDIKKVLSFVTTKIISDTEADDITNNKNMSLLSYELSRGFTHKQKNEVHV